MSFTSHRPIALLVFCLPVFAGSAPGIKNFDKVDAHVYRGAQPTDEGFQYLAKLGVKTIIDLRETDSRSKAEEHVVSDAGMQYINVPMTGHIPPTEAEINKILAMLEDSGTGPVFVHCQRGADRTGAVIAAYHIDHDKWDNVRALQDAKTHSMSVFQFQRQKYIQEFRPRSIDAKAMSPTDGAVAVLPVAATPAEAGVKN
jgi:tyrosine-protein phosphatase SIW14